MIVFIHIPFWLWLNVIFNWNNYFVAINHCFKSAEVLFSHYVIFILYKFLSLIIHIFFEFIAHRRVSNAFKKFDSFNCGQRPDQTWPKRQIRSGLVRLAKGLFKTFKHTFGERTFLWICTLGDLFDELFSMNNTGKVTWLV